MKKIAIVIDDHEGIRNFLRHFLEDKGYDVHTFESIPQPVSLFCTQECRFFNGISCCDVLIVDYVLPGDMNGIDFISQQKGKGCKINKIALISGQWNDDRLHSVSELGYKTFSKPLPMDEFEKWLES